MTLADFWKAVIPGLPALFGAIVGGLIALFATFGLEAKRTKEQKREKFLQDSRESIKRALAWIDPIDGALEAATILSNPNNEYTLETMEQQWPPLADELAKRQLPPESRYLLPFGLYDQLNVITSRLDRVYYDAVNLRTIQTRLKSPKFSQDESVRQEIEQEYGLEWLRLRNALVTLKKYSSKFVDRLLEEYRATYGEPVFRPLHDGLWDTLKLWFSRRRPREVIH